MSEQTPTTEQVRAAFVARHGELRPTEARRVFERWLVAHDAEVKAEAMEEAADNVRRSDWYTSWKVDNYAGTIQHWLRARADRLREAQQ